MDTSKIISLKQELVTLETKVADAAKKVAAKRRNRIIGCVALPLFLIIAVILQNDLSVFMLLLAIIGLVFLILGFIGNSKVVKEHTDVKSRIEQIKIELVHLEHQ